MGWSPKKFVWLTIPIATAEALITPMPRLLKNSMHSNKSVHKMIYDMNFRYKLSLTAPKLWAR